MTKKKPIHPKYECIACKEKFKLHELIDHLMELHGMGIGEVGRRIAAIEPPPDEA